MLGIGEMVGLHEIVQMVVTAMRMCCAVKISYKATKKQQQKTVYMSGE